MVVPMHSRIRPDRASGPAGWLLAFLGARERALRTHTGPAAGPTAWLLVLLQVERADLAARRRPAAVPARRGRPEEPPFGRLTARSA